MRRWLAHRIVLYRPARIEGVTRYRDGWTPTYGLGPLRARILRVRVPTLWALDQLAFFGLLDR